MRYVRVRDLRTGDDTLVEYHGTIADLNEPEAVSQISCECEFQHSFGLICSHIFAILNVCQVKRIIRSCHTQLRE